MAAAQGEPAGGFDHDVELLLALIPDQAVESGCVVKAVCKPAFEDADTLMGADFGGHVAGGMRLAGGGDPAERLLIGEDQRIEIGEKAFVELVIDNVGFRLAKEETARQVEPGSGLPRAIPGRTPAMG